MNYDENYDIAFSVWAGKDIRSIRRYLEKNASISVANKVVSGIFDAVEKTRTNPTRFPAEPLMSHLGNFRVIKQGSYKIFYEFTGQEVVVYRVIHSKRDLQRILSRWRP